MTCPSPTRRPTRRLALALLAPAGLLLLAGPSRAGIVVLRSGGSIVGKIDPARDVTSEAIVVHSPEGQSGTMRVERHQVRWFDAAADAPTRAYFQRFRDEPLERRWDAARAAWEAEQRGPIVEGPIELPAPPRLLLGSPVRSSRFQLAFPLGWAVRIVDGITIAEGDPGPSGYAPRVHAFAAPTPPGEADPVRWIEEELRALPGVESFALEELARPRAHARGTDHELVTRTRVRGREVRALRRVCVRGEWTVVVTAYAAAGEWDLLLPVLRRSLDSLRLGE